MEMTAALGRLLPIIALIGLATVVELLVPLREQRRNTGRRLSTNLTLIGLTLALGIGLNALLVLGSAWVTARGWGILPALGIEGLAATVIALVILDLSGYAVHVYMHKSRWWWKVHLVHHIDTAVDATTALRQHPFEGVLRFAFAAAAAWTLGASLTAIALYRLLSAVNAVLEHANVRVPVWLDRGLVWFWVTPHMHKVHHSRRQAETDSNYANLFSFFDRLFGTFTPSQRGPSVRYGIDGYDSSDGPTAAALLGMPFRAPSRTDPA